MDDFTVGLTNCDIEPIRFLGKIQSHGFLIAVNKVSGLINYVSENISSHIKEEPKNLLGKNLEYLGQALNLNESGSQFLFNQLVSTGFSIKSIESINPYYIELSGKPYQIILALSGNDELIIEFEIETKNTFESQKIIGSSISKILSGTTLNSVLQNAAKEIKKVISYDRVMVYEFGDDMHGEVVAEEKEDFLEPFLHLHYPSSDIPKSSRELYKINLTRIIADVNSESSSIITNKTDGEPLDLTHAELRSVGPKHIEYLKNMGVQSSFSISLICKGELWGLVACHSYTPKFINYNSRSAAKLIGQILSSAIEYRLQEENNEKFDLLSASSSKLIEYVDESSHISEALVKNSITIKDITEATGVALVFEKKITCLGITPGEQQILEITEWLLENMQESVYFTHRFPRIYKPAVNYSGVASGIIACILSRELKEIVIWFKPEMLENIQWGGNPENAVEVSKEGLVTLSPRKSFEKWIQTVKHTSAKWSNAEITSVIKIREHVIYAIRRKANEIRLLNEKLVLAYEELDTFSYTVSHDLRTPLSSIKGYSELLLKNESLDDNAKNILERIKNCTDKMALLITEILNYSRVGQSTINKQVIDVSKIINDIKSEFTGTANINFIVGKTPKVLGDEVMIKQVFDNLISNAIKYTSKSPSAKIIINGEVVKKDVIYSISDNGIGIDKKYYDKVFELFKRMDNVQDIEGSGVGLAIVKKIMEKHQGRVWFESKIGEGTIFYIAFNNF